MSDNELTFSKYLEEKNIDEQQFAAREPERYAEWKNLFEQMHPESFTAMKKFLINPIRRRYPLHKYTP